MPKNYQKFSQRNKGKFNVVYQIIKTIIRVLLLLLLFHRITLTDFGDYGSAIDNKSKNIQEVKDIEQKFYNQKDLMIPAEVKLDEDLNSQLALKDVDPLEVVGKRQEIRMKAKEDILENLNKSNKGITYSKLDIEYDESQKEWKKRTKFQAFIRDPQRFIFIRPLHFFSEKTGIEKSNYALILDIFLKVLVFRLILNWINFPQESQGIPSFGEENEKLQNPYLPLDEQEKIRKKMWEGMKSMFFNLAMTVFFLWLISLHPFAFNRADSVYRKETGWYWWIPYLIIAIPSHLSTSYLWQKLPFREFLKKNILSSILWSIFPIFLIYILGSHTSIHGRTAEFGSYLYFFFGEMINLLINLVKIFFINYNKKVRKLA